MLCVRILESIGCQERGGGGNLIKTKLYLKIKRMLYSKIIESIGCQERGGGGNFDKKNVGFEDP